MGPAPLVPETDGSGLVPPSMPVEHPQPSADQAHKTAGSVLICRGRREVRSIGVGGYMHGASRPIGARARFLKRSTGAFHSGTICADLANLPCSPGAPLRRVIAWRAQETSWRARQAPRAALGRK